MRLNPSFLIPGPPLPIWINLGVSSAIRTLLRLTWLAGSSPDSTAPPPPFPEPCRSHPRAVGGDPRPPDGRRDEPAIPPRSAAPTSPRPAAPPASRPAPASLRSAREPQPPARALPSRRLAGLRGAQGPHRRPPAPPPAEPLPGSRGPRQRTD